MSWKQETTMDTVIATVGLYGKAGWMMCSATKIKATWISQS